MNGARPAADEQASFIRRLLIMIALVGLTLLAWRVRHLLLLVFGAVVVAVILRALADPLHRRLRLPQGVALAATLLLIAGAVAALSWVFGGRVRTEAYALVQSLPGAWSVFEARIGDMAFGERLAELAANAVPDSRVLLSGMTGLLASLSAGLADAILVVVGGIYFAAQPRLYRGGLLDLLPSERRIVAGEALGDSGRALRLWLGGQLMSMLAVGVLVGGGLWLLGVPLPFLLGILAGLFNFIPFAGPIIAGVPAVLLALTISPNTALWTAALCVLVQQVEGNFVLPLLQKKAVDLPPALLIFSLVGFGSLFGFAGVILAAPLTVVAFVLVKRLYVREALATPTRVPGEVAPAHGRAP